MLETEDISDDDNLAEVEDEPVECPDRNERLQVIETLQRFSLFADKGDTIQSRTQTILEAILTDTLHQKGSKPPSGTFL